MVFNSDMARHQGMVMRDTIDRKILKVVNAIGIDMVLLEAVYKMVMMIESGYKPTNTPYNSGKKWDHFKVDGKEFVGHADGRNRPENLKYRHPDDGLGPYKGSHPK